MPLQEFGRIDVLINNAGVMLLGPILDAPVEEWEQMVRVNLLGLMYCGEGCITASAGRGRWRTAQRR